jgi:hypothetical protein
MDSLRQLLDGAECAKTQVPFEIFDKVVDFVEKEQMKPALHLIEKSFSEGICDVRFIFYVYYANFLEKGIVSLQEICPLIISLINEHSHRLVPLNKQEIHLHNSLHWFFSKILSKLKQGDRLSKSGKKQPFLEKSLSHLDEESFESFVKTVNDFQKFFHIKWPSSPTKEKVMHLAKYIEEMRSLVIPEKSPEPIGKTEENKDIVPITSSEEKSEILVDTKLHPFEFNSDLMNGLIKKMKNFESLIEKRDYLKAALVAKDITYAIEHFDPCAYFPQVFSKYLALMTQHIPEIAAEWNQESSLRWGYLDKLYKTDPEQFMNL